MKLLLFTLIILIVNWGCNADIKTIRTKKNFGTDWTFKKDNDVAVTINLPHTTKIEPLVVNDQWQGTAWYQKSFELDDVSNKKTFIYFEGVMQEADVWINDQHISNHKGGYLPFTVDITNFVKPNKPNIIKVKVNNEDNPEIPPGKPLKDLDFNYYGGIYRNVYLITTNLLYITDAVHANKTGSGGALIRFNEIDNNSASGFIQLHIKNDYASEKSVYFLATLIDPEGNKHEVKSGEIKIEASSEYEINQTINIKNPKLWSPQKPNLYDVEVKLFAENKLIDSYTDRIGIRKIELNEDGFYLNEKKIFIRGTNRHQEYPYVGYAISDEAQYRDAVKIKNAGFDFVRLSHYPQAEAFLDACDELGLIVMNCIPGWQFVGNDKFIENAFQDCRDMIRRDRNHPSVMFWEVSLNESSMSDAFMVEADDILKKELPFEDIFSVGWIDHSAFDIFIPARQHAKPTDYWNNYKDGERKIFIAEYGDWEYYAQNAGFNQKEFSDLKKEERTSRQLRKDGEKRLLQQAFNFQEAANSNRKGMGTIGDANWLMFDYNRGYSNDIEASGVSDIFRIPKFSYYFYQSQRSPNESLANELVSGAMVNIASHWNENSSKSIKVYSNCEEVALYLNDSLISKKKSLKTTNSSHLQYPPFVFNVDKFIAGELKAIGYINDKNVAENRVVTPSAASKLELKYDLSNKPISPNFPDMIFIYAYINDEKGNLVTSATNPILFTVEGEAKFIGKNPIEAEAGIATILLRTENFKNTINITATTNGLISDKITLTPSIVKK